MAESDTNDREWREWAVALLRKHGQRRMGTVPMRREIERLCDRAPMLALIAQLDEFVALEVTVTGDTGSELHRTLRWTRDRLVKLLAEMEGRDVPEKGPIR